MANLKDTIVLGNLTVTGTINGNIQSSGGTSGVFGSGTSGYLTKWTGSDTIANGPQLGADATQFLNNKGEWAVPTGTTYTASAGIKITAGNDIQHSNSITEQTTAVLKKITYDAQGHITGTSDVTASDIPSLSYLPIGGGTLQGRLQLGRSSQYEITDATGIRIQDLRFVTPTPQMFGGYVANFYFDEHRNGWDSILHMEGWHTDASGYRAWELAGPASTYAGRLYFRCGTGTTWDNTSTYTDGWRTIAFTDEIPTVAGVYLPLDGSGTMTGHLKLSYNSTALLTRIGDTWHTGIVSRTSGDEAMCFEAENARTSWMFTTKDPRTNTGEWADTTPSLHIKRQKVAINKLIPNSEDAEYTLDVVGTIGASGSIKGSYFTSDGACGIQPSGGNEINLSGSGNVIYFGYKTATGANPVYTYVFCNGSSSTNPNGTVRAASFTQTANNYPVVDCTGGSAYHIRVCSASEFSSLTKDSNTLYFIK